MLNVESLSLDSLVTDPSNARKHDERNLKAIAGSLSAFGQRKPIVVTEAGVVVAGNGTLEAARSLGWKTIDVVRVPKEWNSDQVKAFALADNRSAELASWDAKIMAEQLLELKLEGWDIQELGFDVPEPIVLPDFDEEVIPELAATSKTVIGDVYLLGKHKVICGDSTEISTYKKLLGDEKADLVWTDPPYGVSYVGKTKDALTLQNDTLNKSELENFLRDSFTAIFAATKPGACWYVAAPAGDIFQSFTIPLTELQVWRHTLVWVKSSFVFGRSDYHYRHESIIYGWTPGAAHQTPPDRKQDTVWEFPKPSANREHPTMKPVDLIVRAIQNSSKPEEIVLDSFGGSGSTLIACENTNRIARIIELDPKYVDVIIKRWETLTGLKAELVQ